MGRTCKNLSLTERTESQSKKIGTALQHREAYGRLAVEFLFFWLLPPILLRLVIPFLSLTAHDLDSGLFGKVSGFLVGIAQDLFIAVQVIFLSFLAQRMLKRSRWVFAAVNAILIAGVLSYLVSDFLLCWKTGMRMNLSFLEYARAAACFVSSFQAMGPWALWLGLGIVVLYALACYRCFKGGRSIPRPSFKIVAALGSFLVGVPVASALISPGSMYYSDNAIFALQHSWFLQAASREKTRGWRDAENRSPSLQEFSRAEVFERIDPAHPLLKRTITFKGDRLFDLALKPGARPHVVFLIMESFRAADIGVLGGKHGVSPRFDGLSAKGILFSRFHANGIQTSRGELASLFGILPPFSLGSETASESDMPLVGIPDLFRRRGYRTAYLHNGSLAFDNQDRFFPRHGFDEVHGREEIRSSFPSASENSWGIHDEYLMRYAVEWMRKQDQKGEPFFATMMTMSNHHPWQPPPEYSCPEPNSGVEGEHGRFLRSFSYADWCLGLFWDLLKENGLDQRTIVFILGDHGQAMGEHNRNFDLRVDLYQENLHIPLLILAEGRIPEPEVVDCIGSQVDLLPTVMDIFQMQGVNHALGTSLMRRVDDRIVFFNNPYLRGYWGLRKNGHKYVVHTDTGKGMLYNLDSDPGETKDLASGLPQVSAHYRSLLAGVHGLTEDFFSRNESVARGKVLEEERRSVKTIAAGAGNLIKPVNRSKMNIEREPRRLSLDVGR
jgi:phosphoglycerol transferase MdoB-like AlkP superfamily enzyme